MMPENDQIIAQTPEDDTKRERLLFLLKTLEDMGETLTDGESFDSAARYLLRMLLGAIGISNGAIFTYVVRMNLLRLKAKTRGADCEMDELRLTPEMAKQMAKDPRPQQINALPDFMSEGFADMIDFWRKNMVQVIIPLAVKGDLLGMVCLGQRFMNQEYSPMDLEVLGLLTRHISLYFHSQKSLEQARIANFELRRKILEMEQLYEVGLSITSLKKTEDLLSDILTRSVAILDARYGAIWLLVNGKYTLAEAFGFSKTGSVPQLMPNLEGASCQEVDAMPEAAMCLMAPMKVRDDVLGVLSVSGRESRQGYQEFSDANYQLLSSLASQAAVALDNANLYAAAIEKERMDRELAVAAEIQETLLPASFPADPRLKISAMTLPCRTVGGDFFDFFNLGDGRLGIVIADVSGKSVPAALLVSSFHGALHAMCGNVERLTELVSRLNGLLVKKTPDNKFITAAFVGWDSESGEAVALSAGHEPLLLIRSDGTLEKLGEGGLILGMIPGCEYQCNRVNLRPGDMLCMYTDGVTDRVNASGERFGEERLLKLITEMERSQPNTMIQRVFQELELFAGDEPPPDDQTMVIAMVNEKSST